jgi:hypothetical protein
VDNIPILQGIDPNYLPLFKTALVEAGYAEYLEGIDPTYGSSVLAFKLGFVWGISKI